MPLKNRRDFPDAGRLRQRAYLPGLCEQEIISAATASDANLLAGSTTGGDQVCSLRKKLNVEADIAVTGGGAKNLGHVNALESIRATLLSLPNSHTGALGAAVMGKDIFAKYMAEGQKPTRSVNKLEEATFFE